MKFEKIFLSLLFIVFFLSILLVTKIGYAFENTSNSSFENLNIEFVGNPSFLGTGKANIEKNDNNNINLNVYDLYKVNDYVSAKFTIKNNSNLLTTFIKPELTNTNTEYFDMNCFVKNNILKPQETTTLTVNVKLQKQPYQTEKANLNINIIAEPINN